MDSKEVVSTLNDLIENCKDGEYGFRTCSEHAEAPQLKTAFSRRADECRRAAEELQALVAQHGESPDTHGSVAGALHRGWVNVRGTFALNDDKAMLEECERGEDAAVERYRAALDRNLPAPVAEVVERQFQGVLRNHAEIKAMRDRMAATA